MHVHNSCPSSPSGGGRPHDKHVQGGVQEQRRKVEAVLRKEQAGQGLWPVVIAMDGHSNSSSVSW